MRKTRNEALPGLRDFQHIERYKTQLIKLLQLLYPEENIQSEKFTFKYGILKGTICEIYGSKNYIKLNREKFNQMVFKSHFDLELKALNVCMQYKASNSTIYLYPRDRDEFEDSPLGMEKRAYYVALVVETVIKRVLYLVNSD